jgi:peptidoglycan L-alanyl-D-glutamate endopeptidase CwlK
MDRSLDDLSQRFKPLAIQLLANIKAAGIDCMVIDTLRTPAEQAEALASGHSWTNHSKHLTGDAIDLAPLVGGHIDWNTKNPVWAQMGAIGMALGLTWGGSWLSTPDWGHFEFKG